MNFVAAGIDPTENAGDLRAYKEAQGYPWPVAVAGRDVLQRYNVTSTATKYAIDRHGIIAFQAGYGVLGADRWREIFEDLAAR